MTIKIDELQFKFRFRKDPAFPATMALVIGQFEVRGFQIRRTKHEENKNPLYVLPPSNFSKRLQKWIKLFWTDEDTWTELERRILEAFDNEHLEASVKQLDDE